MPIGKQSINRVAKKVDTEEVTPIAAVAPAKEEKPAKAKKSGSCQARTKTVKLTPPEVDTKQETAAPVVTEHVIANIDPEVVEKVVGKETPAPKDGKVKVTDPMPSYLL